MMSAGAGAQCGGSLPTRQLIYLTGFLCRVEVWRGDVAAVHPLPTLSVVGASLTVACSVSTPRSSNRTCRFPASGFRSRTHAFAHG
jgi:hypothetical protein